MALFKLMMRNILDYEFCETHRNDDTNSPANAASDNREIVVMVKISKQLFMHMIPF